MVLVQKTNGETDKLDEALQQGLDNGGGQDVFLRFPTALERETDSGIIKADLTQQRTQEEPVLITEKELKTRKILLTVLGGLVAVLLAAAGVLFVLPNKPVEHSAPVESAAQEPVPEPPAAVKPPEIKNEEPEPKENPPVPEPAAVEPEKPKDESEQLSALLETVPAEPPNPEIRSTTDVLSDIEKRLPGLLQPAAVLTLNIPKRLAIPLQELTLRQTPLYKVMRQFSELTEVPLTLDVNEFRCREIRVDVPLTQHLENGTAGEFLQQILRPLGLEPVIADRQILITVPKEEKEKILEQKFDVSDLIKNQNINNLAAMLRQLVDLSESELQVDGSVIIAKSNRRMLDEAQRVLEQLRVIRGLPQAAHVQGELLAPEAFCWDLLLAPMTLNYYRPVPLTEVLEQIESKTALKILVDNQSLNRSAAPLNTLRCTVQCNKGTLNEALEKLLASAESASLTFRVVDSSTIEITTKETAQEPEKMTVEVHQLPGKEPTATLPDFTKTVQSAFAPNRWYRADDTQTRRFGTVVIDELSHCFLVRQSQPVQRQIRLWVGKKTGGTSPAADTE
jgi:hypothetical protein